MHGSARPIFVLVLTALLTTIGCSGPRETNVTGTLPAQYPNHSLEDIYQQLTRGADAIRSFSAKARLTLDTPERSGRYSSNLRARGDSIYLTISPGLGIEAARLLVTADSFFVYNRINNRLTYGALSDASDQLPAPLTSGQAFENLLGILAPPPDTDWNVRADSNRYHLSDPADHRRSYVVDPARWRVLRYEEHSSAGRLLEERRFSSFDRFDGLILPRRVVLRRPVDRSSASLFYRDLTLNPSSLSFSLNVPNDAERNLVAR